MSKKIKLYFINRNGTFYNLEKVNKDLYILLLSDKVFNKYKANDFKQIEINVSNFVDENQKEINDFIQKYGKRDAVDIFVNGTYIKYVKLKI